MCHWFGMLRPFVSHNFVLLVRLESTQVAREFLLMGSFDMVEQHPRICGFKLMASEAGESVAEIHFS